MKFRNISSTYASVLKDNPDDNRELIQSYIEKIHRAETRVEDIDRSNCANSFTEK